MEKLMGFSKDKWNDFVNNSVRSQTRTDFELFTLKEIYDQMIPIDGAVFIRFINSAKTLIVTAALGNWKHSLYREIENTYNIVTSITEPTIINSRTPIPSSIKPYFYQMKPTEELMVIPIISENPITKEFHQLKGYVVLQRLKSPFTNNNLLTSKAIGKEYGILFDVFDSTKLLIYGNKINEFGEKLIKIATYFRGSVFNFFERYINDIISLIPNAQAGSFLMETPAGFKYLAISGYTEKLFQLPPIPRQNHVKWYYYGNHRMRKGIPRILTREKIKEIIQTDVVAKTSPLTKEIQVSLGIPIVHNGEVVLFINLENFDSPAAFDDNDIILGQKLASYLVASHQILTLKEKLEKREIIIEQLNEMSSSLVKANTTQNTENMSQIMVDLLINNISILDPDIVMIWTEKSNRTIVFPPETEEDIINELKEQIIDLIPYINLKEYAIGTFHGKNLLIIHKNIPIKENSFISLYIALTRDLPWSSIALNYINSTISSITIYGKNLMYLKTIKVTQEETLKLLGKILEVRDIETKGHTERTANLSLLLAQKLGFHDLQGIVRGAYLHDIGKLAIPDKILLKPGRLTPEEFDIIKSHVFHGYNLIKHIEGLSETTKNVVLYHHEKWDGSGYVHGLKGEEIPLEARIFAVVDVFDALISERPYKKPWPTDKALQEIKKGAGSHFDPKVVEAFEEVIREEQGKKKMGQTE